VPLAKANRSIPIVVFERSCDGSNLKSFHRAQSIATLLNQIGSSADGTFHPDFS
jgi:hypothetical protein